MLKVIILDVFHKLYRCSFDSEQTIFLRGICYDLASFAVSSLRNPIKCSRNFEVRESPVTGYPVRVIDGCKHHKAFTTVHLMEIRKE